MTDVVAFHRLLRPPGVNEIRRFIAAGVSVESLVTPELPAKASVVFRDDPTMFDFTDAAAPGAISAFIFLARDEDDDPCDLVCWSPQLQRVAAFNGDEVSLLGQESLRAPRIDEEQALWVYADPLQWLIAGRQGVVIVDPENAAPILRDAGALKASTVDFGRRLRRLIAPHRATIFVPERATS